MSSCPASISLAHHLAAALLRSLTGTEGADRSLAVAARDLASLPDGASAPPSLSELCGAVGEVPGVRLDRLLTQLTDNPVAIQRALDVLLAQARALADPNTRFARHLAAWDPVIAGITAARGGDDQARAAVEQHLDERQDSADWTKLTAALRPPARRSWRQPARRPGSDRHRDHPPHPRRPQRRHPDPWPALAGTPAHRADRHHSPTS